jgi:hypothetical protein
MESPSLLMSPIATPLHYKISIFEYIHILTVFTSLTNLIPVCAASSLENNKFCFSVFSFEQLTKKRIKIEKKIERLSILYSV